MNLRERNKSITDDYIMGLTLHQLRDKYHLSVTQLSRITTDAGIKPDRTHNCSKADWLQPRLDRGDTARQMAAEAGVPQGTVRYWIRKLRGTLARSRSQAATGICLVDEDWDNVDWFSKKYLDERLGMSAIARLLGKSVGFTSDKLEQHGIPKRTHSAAMKGFRNRPDKEWLLEHYIEQKWSIQKCAEEFGSAFDPILEALREYDIPERSASEQHQGELNEFFGQKHPSDTRHFCAEVGARFGREYWISGDVDAKKALQSLLSAKIWSDSERRRASSERIAELCKQGRCNPKSCPYTTKSGDTLLLRSSWEEAIARWLDSCDVVAAWQYEDVIIQYLNGDDVHNFVVDFHITWVDGLETLLECKNGYLLSKDSERAKISAMEEYAVTRGVSSILISKKEEIKLLLTGYKTQVAWYIPPRYVVKRAYLKSSPLNIEAIKHDIVDKVCPWQSPQYNTEDLAKDIQRLRAENLQGYWKGEELKSTASNSGGMPGRVIMTHFQPHFWQVPVSTGKPLCEAFADRGRIYKCVDISVKEQESLSFERLLREINFHCSGFGRVSHFAPGFARNIIRLVECSGKRILDPCCGWGGRLLGAWLEGCEHCGFDIAPDTVNGLRAIADFVGLSATIWGSSCLDMEWPECDLIFTSPPFYDTERYIGGDQPWVKFKSRQEWLDGFVNPFAEKCKGSGASVALYLDGRTKLDFENFLEFDRIVKVLNRRHARRKIECEYLCVSCQN